MYKQNVMKFLEYVGFRMVAISNNDGQFHKAKYKDYLQYSQNDGFWSCTAAVYWCKYLLSPRPLQLS